MLELDVSMKVGEFPERPGQPVCAYFLKTGDCKFKSGCRFHHPKNWAHKSDVCALSDKGLPLRPVSSYIFCCNFLLSIEHIINIPCF